MNNKQSSFNQGTTFLDIESGSSLTTSALSTASTYSKTQKPKTNKNSLKNCVKMVKSVVKRLHYLLRDLFKLHPLLVFLISLSLVTVIFLVLNYENGGRSVGSSNHPMHAYDLSWKGTKEEYPYAGLRNLVMVAGHSVYTSGKCGSVDEEESWFLEEYQKHKGQARSFVEHIKEGVEIAGRDEKALLLFSGGETRKGAGPRSEAQSYWGVADLMQWFGKQDDVRWRAVTEEHARDSFENLLFSVCRFRELTGTYPNNITVVSYDFKEERFAQLHRLAIGFPETNFFYSGTSTSSTSKESALKGEALVRTQFQQDPYGCLGSLRRKKLGRDPFHRTVPYPTGCPELEGLFKHCGVAPYSGQLPWP